ncbi:piggyBac transposable element-derived protein 3 isoform X5 [Anabrus simplex]|uniref:piggyBac transposable element-derived protein 3 isoform X5 n=1 Tax=Anabrus simplex TaxID=316456 RepID=UPI0035A3CD04
MAASNHRPRGVNCPDDDEIVRLLQDFDSDQSVSDEDYVDWDPPVILTSVQGELSESGDDDDDDDDEACNYRSSLQTFRSTVQDIDQHPTTPTSSRKRSDVWKAKPFPEIAVSPLSQQQLQNSSVVGTPLDYYERYLTNQLFDSDAHYTNCYCLAKMGKELCTSAVEIKTFCGMHLIMGCIPYPRIHMYWKNGIKLEVIANAMCRDRFFPLRTCLHWVDTALPPTDEKGNKLWKVL